MPIEPKPETRLAVAENRLAQSIVDGVAKDAYIADLLKHIEELEKPNDV